MKLNQTDMKKNSKVFKDLNGIGYRWLNLEGANEDEKEVISKLEKEWTLLHILTTEINPISYANLLMNTIPLVDLLTHDSGDKRLFIYKNKLSDSQLIFFKDVFLTT